MTRLTAKDFDQGLLDLYDFYVHGGLTKREFLNRAGTYAVGGVTALGLFNMLKPDYALAEQVSFNDPDITASYEMYDSPNGNGEVRGYVVRPTNAPGKLPAVLVIHENRGLNPYIEDVARRVAKAGFMALAPDGLTSVGGYPGNDAEGKALQKTVDRVKLMNDFFAGYEHLAARDDSTGKVGCVGFCYGGGVCNALAVTYPELNASVPFYGRQAKAEDVARIQAPLLLHYGALDKRINAGWPAYEAALKAQGKTYEAALKAQGKTYEGHIYAGANHGFHNDSTPRYDEPNADLAWSRTIDWFNKHLT
ncbi:MAG: dienelactone hydrolase family protein [Rhodospirillaceae bacterium]|nr:dienelactone hydrolase family protein [Rhodospirillaceae bacterium]MBT3929778.1 dienelactone hydrolase family protein [Rhodospirillaceae bacterium]MBT5358818.1 dienelactone hydrolase family protein [Rhodospirillaceae bacterium]MBT5768132.1 dienelactone hydrolase family protein [Rhodospirillaceae bacterium]MBT6310675.1 dienelactone hydrolase family protein [Rhodospirillaceae bacterium]